MAKRSTEWLTVREIVSVGTIEGTRSLNIVVREQGNRRVHLHMTPKTVRRLWALLGAAVS